MKKKHSVQATLWTSFFLILILIFTAYCSYFVINETKKIREQSYATIHQDLSTISAFVDAEVDALDTVMQNVAYSNLVKEHFATYLNHPLTSDMNNYDNWQNSKILTDLLTAIIGPNRPVDQIYLYSLNKGAFGNGLDNSTTDISVKDFPWYSDLKESENNRIVFCADDPRLDIYYSYDEGSCFITLCSAYYSSFYKKAGIIEVKRSVSSLIEKMRVVESKGYQEHIYIYDPNGNLVYATSESELANDYYHDVSSYLEDSTLDTVATYRNQNTNFLFSKSSFSGFITLITVSDATLYAPISSYLKANLLFFVVIGILCFLITYIVSKIITTPLTKMYVQLQNLHNETDGSISGGTISYVDTSIIELDALYHALIDMQTRAEAAMQREITMHNQEIQSHMLALQSQMNPHFLYNSLATIQAMADENMNEDVIQMCQTISRILRYISSNKEQLVTVADDMAHAADYLQCMKMRFDDDLCYNFDIPEELNSIYLPKLCLQLIIENSIKFSSKSVRPPWRIDVKGIITDKYWEIAIQDNGNGFSEESLQELNEKMRYIDDTELLPSLEINGMGLMNIYIRLKMLFNEKHIFRIRNLENGGAEVVIGQYRTTETAESTGENI